MTRNAMVKRLGELQNEPVICNQDILTITGLMSEDQIAAHLAFYEAWIAQRLTGVR